MSAPFPAPLKRRPPLALLIVLAFVALIALIPASAVAWDAWKNRAHDPILSMDCSDSRVFRAPDPDAPDGTNLEIHLRASLEHSFEDRKNYQVLCDGEHRRVDLARMDYRFDRETGRLEINWAADIPVHWQNIVIGVGEGGHLPVHRLRPDQTSFVYHAESPGDVSELFIGIDGLAPDLPPPPPLMENPPLRVEVVPVPESTPV